MVLRGSHRLPDLAALGSHRENLMGVTAGIISAGLSCKSLGIKSHRFSVVFIGSSRYSRRFLVVPTGS